MANETSLILRFFYSERAKEVSGVDLTSRPQRSSQTLFWGIGYAEKQERRGSGEVVSIPRILRLELFL